jgi:hypothetical protein
MLQQSLWSSYIASSLAASLLKADGVLVLTGAQPALKPTPGMIAYGVAKVSVSVTETHVNVMSCHDVMSLQVSWTEALFLLCSGGGSSFGPVAWGGEWRVAEWREGLCHPPPHPRHAHEPEVDET